MTSEGAKLLRELREERRVSLRRVAKDLGMDPAYLSRIERGDVPPSDRAVSRLASYYYRSTDELFLAAGKVPSDIVHILQQHPELVSELRTRYDGDTK